MYYSDDISVITLPSRRCNMESWLKENIASVQTATGVFSSKNSDTANSLLLMKFADDLSCPSLCIKRTFFVI